ncbi:hypothetical protein ACEPAI_9559 [Sanghuangporus weigelae]
MLGKSVTEAATVTARHRRAIGADPKIGARREAAKTRARADRAGVADTSAATFQAPAYQKVRLAKRTRFGKSSKDGRRRTYWLSRGSKSGGLEGLKERRRCSEEPYRENVVAQANVTEAVWDVIGRRAAEVWREGIEEATSGQFIRRSGGKELDAFVSIIHPKVANDDEVDVSNPLLEEENLIDAHALIDSGCTGSCIDEGFVKRYGFPTQKYIRPRPVFNADSTSNEGRLIMEYVVIRMIFGKHEEEIRLAVTLLASSNIFLGHDWLQKHNPEIDWKIGKINFTCCPDECESSLSKEEVDDGYVRNVRMEEAVKWPPYLEEYVDVFSEELFEQLPAQQT